MASAYPAVVVLLVRPVAGARANSPTELGTLQALVDDVNAIKTELGPDPAGTWIDVVTRLDAIETVDDERTISTQSGMRTAIGAPILQDLAEGATPMVGATPDQIFLYRPLFTQAVTLNSTVNVLVTDSSRMVIGQGVDAATGIDLNTFIVDVPDGTHITLNQPATISGAATLTFYGISGTATWPSAASAYVPGGTDVPIVDGGTGASSAPAALTNLGIGTASSPQFAGINVGHATDTTITRTAAGEIAVEGIPVAMRPQAINPQTGTTYGILAGDAGKLVTLDNTSAIAVTLPQDSDQAIAIGESVEFYMKNTGQATFSAGTGATLTKSGLTYKSRAQYARLGATKVAANTWNLYGDLAAS